MSDGPHTVRAALWVMFLIGLAVGALIGVCVGSVLR